MQIQLSIRKGVADQRGKALIFQHGSHVHVVYRRSILQFGYVPQCLPYWMTPPPPPHPHSKYRLSKTSNRNVLTLNAQPVQRRSKKKQQQSDLVKMVKSAAGSSVRKQGLPPPDPSVLRRKGGGGRGRRRRRGRFSQTFLLFFSRLFIRSSAPRRHR